jgi:hypothetical protein
MRTPGWVAGLVLFAAAGALAQETEPVPADEARTEEVQPARKKIRVLEDPYDIASFYRSRQTRGGVVFGYEDDQALGRVSDDPYAIAGYYRSRQGSGGYGYSRFWTNGYGGTRGRRFGFGRRIGANGDVFLIAPTFLAPLGPLTGAFDLDR